MIHANELQDALNRPPLNKVYSLAGINNIPDQHKLQNFPVQEFLPPGHKLQWNKWRCLNRLRSGVGKTKSLLLKWGYLPPGTDTTCQCGKENQTMNHLLTCKKLEQPAPWMTC